MSATKKPAKKRAGRKSKATRTFYTVATEENGYYVPVNDGILNTPLISEDKNKVREMRDAQRQSGLVILKCQPVS